MRGALLYIFDVLSRLPARILGLLLGMVVCILAAPVIYVAARKRLVWAIALAVCLFGTFIGILIFAGLVLIPRDVDYPEDMLSPEYGPNMQYLLAASMQAPRDLSSEKGGFFAAHVPIVSEQDFPLLARKLKYYLRKAAADDHLFYIIVLGGMKVRDIDEPLLKAARDLRNSGRADTELVIVAPSTISIETRAILEKKGLHVRLIGPPSRTR